MAKLVEDRAEDAHGGSFLSSWGGTCHFRAMAGPWMPEKSYE
jgi:hypothetical protein